MKTFRVNPLYPLHSSLILALRNQTLPWDTSPHISQSSSTNKFRQPLQGLATLVALPNFHLSALEISG